MEAFHTLYSTGIWTILFLYTAFRFVRCVRLVPQRKAYIVERLGKYHTTLGPGFHVLIPYLDRIAYIQDLREEAIEVPPQECFTKDNVRIEVDGIVYISVINPENASYGITDYRFAAIQLAQTTTRSVVGTLELDRTFEERDEVNSRVVGVLAEVGNAWGIQVHRYEVKNIVPPPTVRDAMERQMAAERDRRAVLAKAEGEMRSRINESEGRMKETINRSEGEKQRRINEAQGRAEEILAVAKATAESIEKIGAALSRPGGVEATNLRLSQQLVTQLGNLASGKHSVLLPSDLANVQNVLDTVSLDNGPTNGLVRTDDRTLPSTPAS
ncbi:MAG: stomatin-like protein [Deltaproteobacteria bacterium]|jgi:regulator of protease activity HflC (stomatin/prohibitin superfamily)